MKRLLPTVVLAGVLAALAGGAAAHPSTPQGSSGNGNKTYTCSNQGGGPDHKVVCNSGTLSGTSITISDINVLSGDQLTVLQGSLDNLNLANLDVVTQITDIKDTVLSVYQNDFDLPLSITQIGVCCQLLCL